MKILVTGGTVFISRYTAEYFGSRGHEVYVLNRNTRPQSEGVKLICADRHDLGDKLKNLTFDLVIDVTSYNEEDVRCLVDGLGDFGCYVMISSSAVYPETLPQPFSEDMELGENIHWGAYGTNKIAAEKLLSERVPHAYILRPPYLCGKMNNLYREAYVFDCIENDVPVCVPGDGSLKLQFFDVEDLCRLIFAIYENRPDFRIINTGNKNGVTVNEWVETCARAAGKSADVHCVSAEHDVRSYFPFRNYEYCLDVTRQNQLIGETKPLEQSMAESLKWYRSNHDKVIRKELIKYIKEKIIKE